MEIFWVGIAKIIGLFLLCCDSSAVLVSNDVDKAPEISVEEKATKSGLKTSMIVAMVDLFKTYFSILQKLNLILMSFERV